ncbi:MAG: ParA family protein [Alphaproteobacteria bacterium]|nr:ParA family protein [Alphaproteobacteria bacterium]
MYITSRFSGSGVWNVTQIVAVTNQKGGVGKTTTTINLATALAVIGQRVLVLDIDPQGNASTGLGIEESNRFPGAREFFVGEATWQESIRATEIDNLSIIPGNQDLAGLEVELIDLELRAMILKKSILAKQDLFDIIFIDCPPSLSLLTVNALVAAQHVLIPLQTEFFALEGLSQLMRSIKQIANGPNPQLDILGVVLTMYDKRNNLSAQVAEDVRQVLGEKVFQTVIPRNVRISEAPSYGIPVIVYDPNCAGSEAYIALASEILETSEKLRIHI